MLRLLACDIDSPECIKECNPDERLTRAMQIKEADHEIESQITTLQNRRGEEIIASR